MLTLTILPLPLTTPTLTILPLTLTPTLSGGTPGPCKGYSQSSTHGRMAHRQAVTGLWWRA